MSKVTGDNLLRIPMLRETLQRCADELGKEPDAIDWRKLKENLEFSNQLFFGIDREVNWK